VDVCNFSFEQWVNKTVVGSHALGFSVAMFFVCMPAV